MARSRAERRHFRKVKGLRRLIEDRQQHRNDSHCPCLEAEARKGKGRVFARFADYPQACGCQMCRNPRRTKLADFPDGRTLQEHKASDVSDFDCDVYDLDT